MGTCFAIMRFGEEFADIDRIIRSAAEECGLEYVRGDYSNQPGSVMPHVLREIDRASVIVADVTGNNPNVFYELGIAHQVRGPEKVVILTQSVDSGERYDIHQYRQFRYAHNEEGRARLSRALPDLLRRALQERTDQELWHVIRGRLPRTRLIVRDLDRLHDTRGEAGLEGVTIRVQAGLSSLAIADDEPLDAEGPEYAEALVAERDALRRVLLQGARLRAVLNPPRQFVRTSSPERLFRRYQRMIELMEKQASATASRDDEDVAVMSQCEFALSQVPMPNLIILGNLVAYEGLKRGGRRGFERTHCETTSAGLESLQSQFDLYFEVSRAENRQAHPPDGAILAQVRGCFREAQSFGGRSVP